MNLRERPFKSLTIYRIVGPDYKFVSQVASVKDGYATCEVLNRCRLRCFGCGILRGGIGPFCLSANSSVLNWFQSQGQISDNIFVISLEFSAKKHKHSKASVSASALLCLYSGLDSNQQICCKIGARMKMGSMNIAEPCQQNRVCQSAQNKQQILAIHLKESF